MKKSEQKGYFAPEVEVLETVVEQGFSTSNMESIGQEKDPIGWS